MPHKKSSTTSTRKRKVKAARSARARQSKPLPKNIRLSARQESLLKAQALEKVGVYSPKKKLTVKNFTKSQARYIDKKMHEVMQHGAFINGKAVRPFQRTLKGYKLTPDFKVTKQLAAKKIPGVVKTKHGAILPKKLAENYRVLKDGTLKYTTKRLGKTVAVYSGQLSSQQVIALIDKLEKNEFNMPKGFDMGRIVMFNAHTPNGIRDFATIKTLKQKLDEYKVKLVNFAEKYPNFKPITLEFWKNA